MAKILMMAMSLRKDSLNKKLIRNAHRLLLLAPAGSELELVEFNEFPLPVYDGDLEAQGIPVGAKDLAAKISNADALIFSTPEYNGGMPGAFKNAVDWVSRITPMPWSGKQVLLLGASPGALGAVRGLWHSRVPLEAIGAFVFPEMFGLSKANQAFKEDGALIDSATEQRLLALLNKFRTYASRPNRS